jgi:hypothetical protein
MVCSSGCPVWKRFGRMCWRRASRSLVKAVPSSAHQQRNSVVADHDPTAQPQLGVHPKRPIGPARVLVRLDDQVGQPGVVDRPGRRWPGQPCVVARGRHVKIRQATSTGMCSAAITMIAWNRLLGAPPLGPAPSRGRWREALVSSSAMRRLAAVSSLLSALVRPGSRPRSMRSWRRQV